jgi:hypothetical protein
VNPFPAFFRRIPGRVSETYLKPADSAASTGSTIACALSAESTNKTQALHLLFLGRSPSWFSALKSGLQNGLLLASVFEDCQRKGAV